MLILSACNPNEDYFYSNNDDLYLTCQQSGWTSSTRTSTTPEGNGNFSEGDRIEVRISGERASATSPMEYENGRWTPSLNRGPYGGGSLILSALYPLLPQAGNNETARSLSLPTDQSDMTRYQETDVLFAETTVSEGDPSATLQFHHALHRITIRLKGNIPNDLKIEVRSRTEGQISITNGVTTLDADAPYTWIIPLKQDETTYTALVLPQDATAYQSGEGLIRLTCKGKNVSYPLDAVIGTFNAGMQTILNLTLKSEENDVDMEFCNQTRWVYGITAPEFPGKDNLPDVPSWEKQVEEGIWFHYNYDNMSTPQPFEDQYLTWKDGCGWFDCNKTFKYEGDGNMCWAAAASNMIHWWMAQNKEYIAAYDQRYGRPYTYDRPEKYTKMTKQNQQHSEVFNFFKLHFGNQGSWDTGGINWFINGNDRNLIYCDLQNFYGFFHEVFSKETAIATETRNTSKENFNLWIKDAFRNNRAICFTAFDYAGVGTKRHSMVIWGAEFDAEGNVSNVYYCDNNYGEDEPNHASLRRYQVKYYPSDVPEHLGEEYAFLVPQDYNDGTKPKGCDFTSITLVDLRRDIWQQAFPEITINN